MGAKRTGAELNAALHTSASVDKLAGALTKVTKGRHPKNGKC
jgi:hypothetical protein